MKRHTLPDLMAVALLATGNAMHAADSTVPAKPLTPLVQPRQPNGGGAVVISGELKQWRKVTLTLDGPYAHELDNEPNPFTDCNLTVTFTHESGSPSYKAPGYFAADGNAGETSAEVGTKWRAHVAPDKTGTRTYAISFTRGKLAALEGGGAPVKPFDGAGGSFKAANSDKTGRDFRAKGRLQDVNVTELTEKVAVDVEIASNWKPGSRKDDGKRAGSEKGFRK
jgi:hypothetical protein